MEFSMASHGVGFPMEEKKKKKKDSKKNEKNIKTSTKEFMAVKMQEKEYPFSYFDVPHIFDELLARKLIELPQPKCLEEVGKTNNSKYWKYYRVVSHPIEKYFVFEDKIMALT
ncbi:hypothetical protein CDL12_25227 [Handroanthus impetiginosus]|uniref:Uncharacterized protein n=1 Tax=Handroanthus impetiginosus TaxID=429701 RepID=A0A2G9GAE9_9LAMI|nr:hypothetical protein CDL12_25227 [Handroanthus impetiginosus]